MNLGAERVLRERRVGSVEEELLVQPVPGLGFLPIAWAVPFFHAQVFPWYCDMYCARSECVRQSSSSGSGKRT